MLSPDAAGPCFCSCRVGRAAHARFEAALDAHYQGRAGVPPVLAGCTLTSARALHETEPARSAALHAALAFVKAVVVERRRPGGLVLLGTNGVGKSGLCAAVTRSLRKTGRPVLWVRYDALMRSEQDSYGKDHQGLPLLTAERAPFLVLDELGDAFARGSRYAESEDRRRHLYQLIAHRHERRLPLLVTANYASLQDLAEQFDPRIADRLREMCSIHVMRGESLRAQPVVS